MADTAVTSRTLTVNALSVALDSTSTAGTSVATGNVAVMTPAGGGNTRQVVITMYGVGADATVTFSAGVEPPSETSGLGDGSALTIASGKAYALVIDAGRWVQANGTVRATVGGTGPVVFNCFTIPRSV